MVTKFKPVDGFKRDMDFNEMEESFTNCISVINFAIKESLKTKMVKDISPEDKAACEEALEFIDRIELFLKKEYKNAKSEFMSCLLW